MVHWSRSSGPEQTLDSRQMMMMMEKAKNKSVEIIAMTLRWDRSKSENIKTVLHFLPHSCDRWTTTYQVQSSHSCSGALPRHVERLILIHTTYRLIVILLERKMWERSVSFTQQHGHRCHSLNMIKMYDRKLWQIITQVLFYCETSTFDIKTAFSGLFLDHAMALVAHFWACKTSHLKKTACIT